MKDFSIQSLDLLMMSANQNAIRMEDKYFVMDNLEVTMRTWSIQEIQAYHKPYPIKLTKNYILILVEGTLRFSVNFRDYVMTAGMCAVITAGTIIERADSDSDAKFIVLSFKRHDLGIVPSYQQLNVHRLYALQVAHVTLLPQQLDMLIQSYKMLRTILTDKAFSPLVEESANHCICLIASIIENRAVNQADVSAKTSRQDEIVSNFLQCVADNYREHRELGFYAAQLCLSLKYMSHVVYSETGRHPSQWIKDYVILDAKTMLRSGRYTVQQVADELHFPNQSFFGKYFKEAVGVSPKKWK